MKRISGMLALAAIFMPAAACSSPGSAASPPARYAGRCTVTGEGYQMVNLALRNTGSGPLNVGALQVAVFDNGQQVGSQDVPASEDIAPGQSLSWNGHAELTLDAENFSQQDITSCKILGFTPPGQG